LSAEILDPAVVIRWIHCFNLGPLGSGYNVYSLILSLAELFSYVRSPSTVIDSTTVYIDIARKEFV